ncbi:MAG: transporter substrate-binding domain-containing protein [Halopseudomonas sp.]
MQGPFVLTCLITALLCFQLNSAQADNFTFATSDYPPFQYLEDDQAKGFKLEILREAFARAGHTLTVEFFLWSRVLKHVEKGRADFTTGQWHKSRAEYAGYSEVALFDTVISLFGLKGRTLSYSGNITELSRYSIITVDRFSYGSEFNQALKDNTLENIVSAPNTSSAVKMLKFGRADLLISNRHVAISAIQQLGYADDIQELTPPISTNPSYILYTKTKDLGPLRQQIDAALVEMANDGTLKRLNRFLLTP